MKKRILSFVLSLAMLVSVYAPFNAFASSYEDELVAMGFPKSYVSYLTELHSKYPNWVFKPFKTNLTWDEAVNGERTPHKDQRLQKISGKSDAYFCKCSTCYKNGSYVVWEGSNWVSASEQAVAYYMDPRNWLSEKYIFQFESTAYDTTQTQSGVESIIGNTWMANSYITYYNPSLETKTYTKNGYKVKYSTAIIDAAKNSGMSAYYLASKIVQEVGGAKPTAGGVCGNRVPFTGIYNYYNIGAYGGADDGLAWAAGFMRANKDTYLYPNYDSTTKKVSGTKTKVAKAQYMTWMGGVGDYYKVRLYNELGADSYSKDGKIGYILKADCRTTYFNYSRPWTNPYKAIYNGAVYISNGYSKDQFTGYLQKFNVNKDSGMLYSHEYMTNLDGAASEAGIAYNAYKNANILNKKILFYIPVYKNMPAKNAPVPSNSTTSSSTSTSTIQTTTQAVKPPSKVINLTKSSRGTTYITLSWSKLSNATGYYVYTYNSSTKKYTKIATVKDGKTSYKHSNLTPGTTYRYAVAAYNSGGTGEKSARVSTTTLPKKVSIKTPTTSTSHTLTAKWYSLNNCTGYAVQYSRYSDFKEVIATVDVKPNTMSSYVGKNFTKGVKYYIRVRAYRVFDGKKVYGPWSATKSIVSK